MTVRGVTICVVAQLRDIVATMDVMYSLTADGQRARSAEIARALADPKRICVLEQLAEGERSVSDLSRDAGCAVPNMSQHLAVLRQARLVKEQRRGRFVHDEVDPDGLALIAGWLAQ